MGQQLLELRVIQVAVTTLPANAGNTTSNANSTANNSTANSTTTDSDAATDNGANDVAVQTVTEKDTEN